MQPRLPKTLGIIPAHAGSRRRAIRSQLHKIGSSPRMRGAGLLLRVVEPSQRIIPAHAGSR